MSPLAQLALGRFPTGGRRRHHRTRPLATRAHGARRPACGAWAVHGTRIAASGLLPPLPPLPTQEFLCIPRQPSWLRTYRAACAPRWWRAAAAAGGRGGMAWRATITLRAMGKQREERTFAPLEHGARISTLNCRASGDTAPARGMLELPHKHTFALQHKRNGATSRRGTHACAGMKTAKNSNALLGRQRRTAAGDARRTRIARLGHLRATFSQTSAIQVHARVWRGRLKPCQNKETLW